MLTKANLYLNLYKNQEISVKDLLENVSVENLTPEIVMEIIKKGEFNAIVKSFNKNEYAIDILFSIKRMSPQLFSEIDSYLVESGYINDLAKEVIKSGDATKIYFLAYYFKGAPLNDLEDALIELKDLDVMGQYSRDVRGSDKLAEAIDKFGTAKDKYFYIKYAKEASFISLAKLINSIFKSKDTIYIKEILKDEDINLDLQTVLWGISILKEMNIDASEILERYQITDKSFIAEIKNKGLIEAFQKTKYSKKYVLNMLINKLPETEKILQVYYEFLTTDMYPADTVAMMLDLEYKTKVLKDVKKEVVNNLNSNQRVKESTRN